MRFGQVGLEALLLGQLQLHDVDRVIVLRLKKQNKSKKKRLMREIPMS
jgi:hypothetical protein